MKRKPKRTEDPRTGSPVLDAWALLSKLRDEGVDASAALDGLNGTPSTIKVEPPTVVSSDGLPIVHREELEGMPPERVASYFYDRVLTGACRGNAEWDLTSERLRTMPQHWRLVYSLCWLQAEVDNGGHEPFFFNGCGAFEGETEADLRYIGADQFLTLFLKARRFFHRAPSDNTERIPEIEPLDDAFYAQKKDLHELVGGYILCHLEDYCTG